MEGVAAAVTWRRAITAAASNQHLLIHFSLLLLVLLSVLPAFISTAPQQNSGTTRAPSHPAGHSSSASVLSSQSKSSSRPSVAPREEFDFIVVGGGSSGSIAAARLAQANHSVLLLEAGGPTQHSLDGEMLTVHPNLTLFDVPLYWTDITANPLYAAQYEWELFASPHPQVARGLGGCSVHNAMIYIRGLDRDFDDWGVDWDYQTVMKFYRRSVSQQDVDLMQSPLHAPEAGVGGVGGGEVHLSSIHSNDRDPISSQFIASCAEAGLAQLRDFNGAHRREGAGYYQFLIREGQRETPASALYGKGSELRKQRRGKLTIRTYAQVTKVVMDTQATAGDAPNLNNNSSSSAGGNDTTAETSSTFSFSSSAPRAVGVQYVLLPQSPTSSLTSSYHTLSSLPFHVAYARHEIVLSAGAINSPKLLLLSGIGPRADLVKLGIDVVKELEGVGRNAMDGSKVNMQWDAPSVYFNPCIPHEDIGGRRRNEKDEEDVRRQQEYCDDALQRFFAAKEQLAAIKQSHPTKSSTRLPALSYGIMGTPGFSAGAFLKSHSTLERPNIQLTVFPWDKVQRQWKERLTGVVTLEVATNNPISRGRVGLHSRDWFDPPYVNVNYLGNRDDVEVILWAIKRVREIVAVGPLNATLVRELVPGSGMTDDELRDYILCGAKEFRQGDGSAAACDKDQSVLGHIAGTVQMGNPYVDAYACVDSHLRVIGVEGLRVADASIMPILPSGNTHATCMMIGERAADFLLQHVRGEEKGRGEEEQEQEKEEELLRSVEGGETVWQQMGGWKVVAFALLFAVPLTVAYWFLSVIRDSRADRREAEGGVGGHREEREDVRRPLLAGQERRERGALASSAINNE